MIVYISSLQTADFQKESFAYVDFYIYPEANISAKEGCGGQWRGLHDEELHSLYHSPNVVRVIKSRGLRWAGHVGGFHREG